MLTFTERTMRQEKGELMNYPINKNVVLGTRNNWKLASLYASNCLFVPKKISVKLILLID